MKLTQEQIDKVRHIEGFPIAKNEDIIALSQPPHYTVCPNPFIDDFIAQHGTPFHEATDSYHREPFAADVSEGKSDPIYMAHSYHTKVPYKAIMRYILHYTDPGDIVFDGFSGTGMTGVAAQACGSPENEFKHKIEGEMPYINWGERKAILNDLSPVASFISSCYNTSFDLLGFEEEVKHILSECERECGWMYETPHLDSDGIAIRDHNGKSLIGKINYTVWSDILICPNCSKEIVYWEVGVNKENGSVKDVFLCKFCNMELGKNNCEKASESYYDSALKSIIHVSKQHPVLINYTINNKRHERETVQDDIDLLAKIEALEIPYWYPYDRMPDGIESRRNDIQGITHAHHFFTKRNLWILSLIYNKIQSKVSKFLFTSIMLNTTKMYKYRADRKGGIVSGTLFIPALNFEIIPTVAIYNKLPFIRKAIIANKSITNGTVVSCSSSDSLNMSNDCIDYIFTDPPFGYNLNYSELNFLWEAWLKVFTNNKQEAVMNRIQKKGLADYQQLMELSFSEYYRILKPGRWMTVEFHNSQNSVWNAIQEALLRAGFIVADVRTLDKQQGSFKQVTNTSAVKQDLVISAYKPKESFKRRFLEHAGSEDAVWDFVRQHLVQLPIIVVNKDSLEIVTERQNFLLFDRMVAFHIMNGISVPLDASDFYKGLKERFIERDSMYFLADQVNEYDEKRLKMDVEPIQMSLMVVDEKSAIAWLYAELGTPQTRQDLQPKFMQELHKLKHEVMPELDVILNENFLQNDKGEWFVADLNKQSDLDKLRNKRLLKDYEEYVKGTGRLKIFRTEAIRAGFDHAWKQRDFAAIVNVGKRLPENVIQEDPAILMYYDNALSRIE